MIHGKYDIYHKSSLSEFDRITRYKIRELVFSVYETKYFSCSDKDVEIWVAYTHYSHDYNPNKHHHNFHDQRTPLSLSDRNPIGLLIYLKKEHCIYNLCVHKDYRRQKVATALMNTALDYIRKYLWEIQPSSPDEMISVGVNVCTPIKYIYLNVNAENSGAISFYKQFGFRKLYINQSYIVPYYFMRLRM